MQLGRGMVERIKGQSERCKGRERLQALGRWQERDVSFFGLRDIRRNVGHGQSDSSLLCQGNPRGCSSSKL